MSMLPLVMMAAAVGWADIAVQPSKGPSPYLRGVASLTRPSERTVETLKRYDLEARLRRDPDGAMAALENAARRTLDPELVFALAELSWIEGQALESRRLARRRQASALDR